MMPSEAYKLIVIFGVAACRAVLNCMVALLPTHQMASRQYEHNGPEQLRIKRFPRLRQQRFHPPPHDG